MPQLWPVALLASAAVHAGFQAAVTVLVYPALARVPDDRWAREHAVHSRRITPLVAVVYGAALVSCAGALLTPPGGTGEWVAAGGTAAAVLVTAVTAAPTHGRLGRGRTSALMRRLLLADRFRLAAALVGLAGAVAAAG